MITFKGIELQYRNTQRDNYMSLFDAVKDLTTHCLIDVLKACDKFKDQMTICTEIEKRNELKGSEIDNLLENYCNGI
jgi:hypothetical protein